MNLKVQIDIEDQLGDIIETTTLYKVPIDGVSRTLRIASVIEKLMDRYPTYSIINIQMTKDADERKSVQEHPAGKHSPR